MLPIIFYYHNRSKNQIFLELEKGIFRYISYPSIIIMSSSGIWLAVENFSVMKSDWFYLKIFLLFPLFIIFFHMRSIVHGNKIVEYGYSDRFFKIYALIPLVLLAAISYLALYKP